jgi:hypothetical protein
MKEKTLLVHMCEQKRRHLARTEKHVQIGYQAYNRFYQLTQKFQGNKTYEAFAKSPYYNAFIKFGSFVSNVNPLYPDNYIDWVVTSNVKLDHWCRQELYDKYVLDLIKTENVETALQRSLAHMMDWAEEKNAVWNHYFDYVSLSRATFDIRDGKVSPWVILNSVSGKTMLSKFNDEQLEAVSAVIDPEFWIKKFRKQKSDVELVKQVLEETKL